MGRLQEAGLAVGCETMMVSPTGCCLHEVRQDHVAGPRRQPMSHQRVARPRLGALEISPVMARPYAAGTWLWCLWRDLPFLAGSCLESRGLVNFGRRLSMLRS